MPDYQTMELAMNYGALGGGWRLGQNVVRFGDLE